MSAAKYNMKNSAVKRILQEVKEMQSNPSDDYLSLPLEDNIFEWQFAIRGPQDTEFEGGIYHGRIQLPSDYPFKPPAFMLLTPNGRFETQTKICLSISQYHPEHWQPSWSVRTALVALIAFLPTKANGAIGSLEFSKEERKALALKSTEASPKYGTAERQMLIDEIHEQMLKRLHSEQASKATGGSPVLNEETDASSTNRTHDGGEELSLKDGKTVGQGSSLESGNPVRDFVSPAESVDEVAPLAAHQAVQEPPIRRANTRHQTSDDRGLTLLAVGLVVALAALLLKKFHSQWWINF